MYELDEAGGAAPAAAAATVVGAVGAGAGGGGDKDSVRVAVGEVYPINMGHEPAPLDMDTLRSLWQTALTQPRSKVRDLSKKNIEFDFLVFICLIPSIQVCITKQNMKKEKKNTIKMLCHVLVVNRWLLTFSLRAVLIRLQ